MAYHRPGALQRLTPRDREVLELMAGGHDNPAVVETLVVTAGAPEAARGRPPQTGGLR